MMVAVVGMPRPWASLMIRTHSSVGDLLGADPVADRINEDLRRRSAQRAEAGRLHCLEHFERCSSRSSAPHRRPPSGCSRGGGFPGPLRGSSVYTSIYDCAVKSGWRPLTVQISVAPRDFASRRFLLDLSLVVKIRPFFALFLRVPAEPAGVHADIGDVDVLVQDPGDGVSGTALPHLVGGALRSPRPAGPGPGTAALPRLR